MYNSYQSKVTLLCVTILTSVSLSAQDFSWDSGGSNTKYENSKNWKADAVPYSAGKNTMFVEVNDGGTVIFDDATGTQVIDLLELSNGSTLNMSGGFFDHSRSGNVVRTSIGKAGIGSTVNQTGGKMTIGHALKIGDKKATGTYNLTGGELTVFRGGRSLIGGSIDPSISIGPSGSKSDLNISGGQLTTRGGVEIDSHAAFNVVGADASSIKIGGVKLEDPGKWYQKGTLGVAIGAGGVTKIDIVAGTRDSSSVQFLYGSELDLSFHGVQPFNGSWTVMELEGAAIEDNGLVLSAATQANPGWSFKVDNTGGNGRLIATYKHYVSIPEPLSYSIFVGAACLMALSLRRVRRS